MDAHFKAHFPALTDVAAKKTSEPDESYNCIAWAFEDNRRFWWPSRRAYWPVAFFGRTVKQAFDDWLLFDGWSITQDRSYSADYFKIALYEFNGTPTHAARLLPSNLWTSKLGRSLDLAHTLDELEGPSYGQVSAVYQKHSTRSS